MEVEDQGAYGANTAMRLKDGQQLGPLDGKASLAPCDMHEVQRCSISACFKNHWRLARLACSRKFIVGISSPALILDATSLVLASINLEKCG